MSGSFLSSVTGLQAQQARLDTVANNLANVATPGFKAMRVDLTDRGPAPLEVARAGAATNGATEIGGGVQLAGTSATFSMGALQLTSRPTDLAILGDDGFFQVRGSDGQIAYTRDGSFSVDANGQVVNGDGDALEPPVQVPAGATIQQVTADGALMGTLPGATTAQVLGQVELASFPNPNGLQLIGGNRYAPTAAAGQVTTGVPGSAGLPEVGGGVLESSNVDFAEQATTMIEAQRAYSMNLKAVQTLDDMVGLAVQLRS